MNSRKLLGHAFLLGLVAMTIGIVSASAAEKSAAETNQQLQKLETKAPDTRKPVKVFILMGQSNMVGMGDVVPETARGTLAYLTKKEGKYPYVLDETGNWVVRNDVWCVKTTQTF